MLTGVSKSSPVDPLIITINRAVVLCIFSQYCEISARGNCTTDLLILGPDRIYGVVSFPEKFDKSGMLVRKYCPELAGFPDKVRECVPRARVFEY